MCEGASKRTPDLSILPRRDRAPGFEIPGYAPVCDSVIRVQRGPEVSRVRTNSCSLIWSVATIAAEL